MYHMQVRLRGGSKKYASINNRIKNPRGAENRNKLTEPPFL